jgi:predicted nucleic acid-binding protein
VARVNVFLRDDLLKAIDQEAARSSSSRSALLQAALKGYLEAREREREASERRRAMEDACRRIDRVAERLGRWDPARVIEVVPAGVDLLKKANAIAGGYGVTVYDALYVALAELRGYPLITADERLLRGMRGHSIVLPLRSVDFRAGSSLNAE